MDLWDKIVHFFDPPSPECAKPYSELEEAEERQKWRDIIHDNRGAAGRVDAAAQVSSRKFQKNKEAAAAVAEAAVRALEALNHKKGEGI